MSAVLLHCGRSVCLFAATVEPQSIPPAFAESSADVIFQHLNESNGLTSPVVTSFAEDGDGFLWVGTQNGLQRWDGYRFSTYKTKLGDQDSLPDNWVQALYTDQRGRLWVGTNSGGLARYDRDLNRFVRYRPSSGDTSRASVAAIIGDGDQGLWIGTETGLCHFGMDDGSFEQRELAAADGSEAQSRRVTALARTADGTLWVGTELGLEVAVNGGALKRLSLPSGNGMQPQVSELFVGEGRTVWVATQHGLYIFSGDITSNPARAGTAQNAEPAADFLAQPVRVNGPQNGLLATERILSVAETSRKEIWVGTQDHGILALSPSGPTAWQVRPISHNAAVPSSVSSDWIPKLFLGRSGILWIASHSGVNYLDTLQKGVFTVLEGAGPNVAAGSADVYSILARKDGSVWLGLTRHGIDILDSQGLRMGAIRTAPAGSLWQTGGDAGVLPEGTISCLNEAPDGTVYICSEQGLYRTNEARQGTKAASQRRISKVSIGTEAAKGLVQVLSDGGKLWIGGSNGLWTFDPSQAGVPAKRPPMQIPLTDQRVTVIERGPGQTLWIGTQNGLNLYDMKTGVVEAILPDAADPLALGGGFVSTLMTDNRGRVWAGTFSGGVDVLDHRDAGGRARFHRILDGLPNENVDMLLEAPDGNIWASTDGGLAVIDPERFEVRTLGRAEGATIPAYWNSVGAVTAAGDLLFGGIGGFSVVRPGLVKRSEYQPPVVVTTARIGTIEVPASRFNSGVDIYPVWIPSDQNNLTVEFAALDYTSPERNRYAYKLEGFDRDWIPADPTRRVARYTNLPPGRYTLLLRGSNRDGVWASERRVRILVLPKWYQEAWFRVFAVVVGFLCLAGLFQLATAYLRRQRRELERQVALRTAELRRTTVELQESKRQLEHMAYTDPLTSLPNRRMFTEHFRRLLALKRRQSGTFAVLLMDFDDFKEINDTHGHDAGDAVLKEMARRMMALVRESDCLARLGGDEFGLLLADRTDLEGTDMVCHKVIESFAQPILFEGLELRTAPSIGIAIYPGDGESQDTLYKTADIALYHAKRKGGNMCCWSERAAEALELQ